MSVFTPTPLKRLLFFVVLDLVLSFVSLYLAYQFRFSFKVPADFYNHFLPIFFSLASLKIGFLYVFRAYLLVWRYFSIDGLNKLVKAHIGAYASFLLLYVFFGAYLQPFARAIILIDGLVSIILLSFVRLSKRYYLESKGAFKNSAVIIGIENDTGLIVNRLRESNFFVDSLFTKQEALVGGEIFGTPVYALENMQSVLQAKEIKMAVIAHEFPQEEINEIFERLKNLNIQDIKVYKPFLQTDLKEISIEDLLARKPKDLDKKAIFDFLLGKRVLITGAGGSIGSQLTKTALEYGAKEIIAVDNSEYNIYTLMSAHEQSHNITFCLEDIANTPAMREIFKRKKIDIVLHAAASKHVFIVENNMNYAVRNNILATKALADLSAEMGADTFLFISTDKAVRPTSVMGATKRVCELYLQNMDAKNTKMVCVRFGNVLGSSGSVVPKFKSQIKAKQPLSVTHPEVTRFFMLPSEACLLVLQAASLGAGGEVFVLDMGRPVKIVDLAKKMLKLTGNEDLGIVFTGLKKGEKLYEELLINERDKSTKYQSIFVAQKTPYDINLLQGQIQDLAHAADPVAALKQIVKEFARED